MKIKENKLIGIILIILTVALLIPSKVLAAGASISTSASTIKVGETATISINVSNVEVWEVKLSSSGGTLSTTSGTDAYDGEQTTTALTSTFSATKAGTYTISYTGTVAGTADVNNGQKKKVSGSVQITVKEKETTPAPPPDPEPSHPAPQVPEEEPNLPTETKPNNNKPQKNNETKTKSSNNYLQSLSTSVGMLTPEFYRETYDYTLEFDDTVDLYNLSEIEVSGKTEDEKAKISGTGKITLAEGENNIEVNVTAEDGKVRTYKIKVVKPKAIVQSDLRLKTLIVNGINEKGEYQTIDLDFDAEKFEYDIKVPNEISSISINPSTENEDIILEQIGDTTLIEGENKILITLTSPSDKEIVTTYTINITKEAPLVQEVAGTISQKQMIIIGVCSGSALLILIIIIAVIVRHKKKKKAYDYDEDDVENNQINFIENTEGEDVDLYPYPAKIDVSENEENKNVEPKIFNSKEEKITKAEDIEPAKLKWDDFVDTKENSEEEPKAKKSKKGKRFM